MSSSDRVVPDKVLFALCRQGEQTAKSVASHTGTFGEAVANAVETKHLHKAVFGLINRLNKMDEAKRNDFLLSLPIYIEKMQKVWGAGGHVGDFIEQAEQAERDEERARQAAQSDQERDDSVARIETGIKGVPDPDHPNDPDKVTTIADARAKKAERESTKVDRGAKRAKREPRTKEDVKAAAERAFTKPKVAGVEDDPDTDEAGNHLPPDISGDEFAGEQPVGMPGAEPPTAH